MIREIKTAERKTAPGVPRLLLLNAGSRNALIRQFEESFGTEAELIVSDSYELAPALYEASRSVLIPHWTTPGYMEEILAFCRQEKVTGILSLLDPDLSYLAGAKAKFEEAGILPFVSEPEWTELCFDKLQLARYCTEQGIPVLPSFASPDEYLRQVHPPYPLFPVMVKPRCGSGSAGLHVFHHENELLDFFATQKEKDGETWLLQAFLKIRELGVDLYFDLRTKRLLRYFIKEKLKMRAGETDKSAALRDPAIERFVERLASAFPFRGPIDMDLFITEDGTLLLSEINPRFGGGYLHAYAAGVRFPDLILRELQGLENHEAPPTYRNGSKLMKYFSYTFLEGEE